MSLSADSFTRACREGGVLIENWLRVFDRQHGAALYREAAHALRSWHAGQDVVQDAMVKVWLRCATFRGSSDPLAWVRQIVRNAIVDAVRARHPEQPLHDEAGELTPAVQDAVARLSAEAVPAPEQALQERQVEQIFRACFERFRAAHAEHALVLGWVVEDGLDNAAVAALLDRTPGATREFISQCRRKARPYFAPWYALLQSQTNPQSNPQSNLQAQPQLPKDTAAR